MQLLTLVWSRRRPPSENAILIALAVTVGLTSGFGVFLFKHGIEWFTEFYQHELETGLFAPLGAWAIVPVLALAGLIIGTLLHRFIGEERHHGVAGIMESVALAGGRLRYKRMPLKALLAAFSIGAGASVGPEDPSVQIGANAGSFFGQRLHLSDERVRVLVAAGAASGVAAAFQAPIAGVFFALEIILGDLAVGSLGVVVLSSVVAAVFTHAIEPGGPELGIRFYSLGGIQELPLYILLGVLAAPLSALFIRLLYWQHDLWHHWHIPRPLKTALAGALVGLIAVYVPEVMGTGRETMNGLLNAGASDYTIPALLLMAVMKMLATTISQGGGFVGGMFAPSLFVGAAFGSAFGIAVNALVPSSVSANPAAYAMVGMAAAMTGVIRAPITAILLLFELTHDYNLILPVMLVTTVCLLVVDRLAPDGLYQHGLARKGIRLAQGRDIDLMETIPVREAMNKTPRTVSVALPADQLEAAFAATHTHGLLVVDDLGRLVGIVTLQDMAHAREKGPLEGRTVGDIANHDVVTVLPDLPIASALGLLQERDFGRLPVVAPDDPHKIVGVLRRRDLVRAYDLARQRKLEGLYQARQLKLAAYSEHDVLEWTIAKGAKADQQPIKAIAWPPGCIVAAVHRNGSAVIPRGNTILHAGDRLTLVGKTEHTAALTEWLDAR